MANYLTEQDLRDYGSDLIDVTQRAALHALSPELQEIRNQNAELQRRLAQEQRHRLDSQVAAAVPDYREIDRDPRWHAWLRTPDQLSGVQRQQLLNDAVASGSAQRVRAFFDGFRQEAGGAQQQATAPGRTRSAPSPRGRIYTRDEITRLYSAHQRGAYAGREAEWARQEMDLIAAGREGRIRNPVDVAGK